MGNLPKLNVVGSIPIARSIASMTWNRGRPLPHRSSPRTEAERTDSPARGAARVQRRKMLNALAHLSS